MIKGWEFRWEARRFFVGAPDAATAKQYLAPHCADTASTDPAQVPRGILAFLELGNGTVRVAPGWRRASSPERSTGA
jgi:hypothetical protein